MRLIPWNRRVTTWVMLSLLLCLAMACQGPPGEPGPQGMPGFPGPIGDATHAAIGLEERAFATGQPIALVLYGTGWADSEAITLHLQKAEGGLTVWAETEANRGGMFVEDLEHAGLDAGVHAVLATGSSGGKASTWFLVAE